MEYELLECEKPTRNGRIYHLDDVKREIECERSTELIKAGCFFGEFGYPKDFDLINWQTISILNHCVKFLKFDFKGNTLYGEIEPTKNDKGMLVKHMIENGETPEFGIRAMGHTNKNKEVEDLKLITFDLIGFKGPNGATLDV